MTISQRFWDVINTQKGVSGTLLRFTLFLHTVTLSAHYINRGHNIEFQRTEGSKSIVICLNSVSIQRSALWLFPDTRLQRRKGGSRWGEQGQHKHSRASEHQHFEPAPGFGFAPLLKANPQMRGPRCVNGVSGGTEGKEQSISICQIFSRSAFLKFQTLLLNFKGNEEPEVKEDLF